MATIRLSPDFKDFLKLLNNRNVEYLIVGGYAVGYHGYPRPTGDLDVWIATTPNNASKIVAVLEEFGFPNADARLFKIPEQVIRMGVPPVRIEIQTSISGVDFASCYANRIIDEIDGVRVSIIDLEHLKANKKAAGRHRDLDDLERLP